MRSFKVFLPVVTLGLASACAAPSVQHAAQSADHTVQASGHGVSAVASGAATVAAVPVVAAGAALSVTGAAIEAVGAASVDAGHDVLASGLGAHGAPCAATQTTPCVVPDGPPELN